MLASLPEPERAKAIRDLTDKQAEDLLYDWKFWARPKQLAPLGDWAVWIIRAGRGFGKTRSGSGWLQQRAMEQPGRWMALIAKTPADARDYNIEGPGGLLRNIHPDLRPSYEVSKRRVTWPNGSWATIYSDEEPDQLRGFSGDTAWLDEFAKFKHPVECWDNLQFGMREASNDRPRCMITTTPRPLKILTKIERRDDTVVTVGNSYENRSNLDPNWFNRTIAAYEGSRWGRQEIHAEILDDVPGALWTQRNIDRNRLDDPKHVKPLERLVVAIDPAITSGDSAAETGIIAGGIDESGHGYVLADASMRGTPDEWARAAVALYRKYEADRIVAEVNQGGEMVAHVIRSVAPDVPVTMVRASRGKMVRAEPISALYEQDRVSHVGMFPELEDQMLSFVPENVAEEARAAKKRDDADGYKDRVDALVWCMASLFDAMVNHRDWRDEPQELPVTPGGPGGY